MDKEAPCAHALQICSSTIFPFTIKTAIELRLLDVIAEAESPAAALYPAQIVAQLPAAADNLEAADMVDRLLRLLASYGVVTCTTEATGSRKYSAAPVTKYLVKNGDDGASSMANLALLSQDRVTVAIWDQMKDSVLHGGLPVQNALGMLTFEHLGSDARLNKVFNDAMCGYSVVFMEQLLQVYHGFDDVNVLVDVGGNAGATLRMITSEHPHIRGINFDVPHVISQAPPIPGVQHVSGDMFEAIPSGDAIFMKWILHDWSDEHCVKILKNCREALAQNGKVIVAECLLPELPAQTVEAQAVFQMDLAMMACCLGGKERSEKEFKALAMEAGFRGFELPRRIVAGWAVMEFTK
ncbi:caffeic acid 3-O-methyltransferase-like [Zingiber officinale]|uniref:Uncharacterized protein n=1 Tax=Zingiber officinale TaxID=94328 RepID=A0A8J5I0Y9_ZINOF|nr:caffeic acid 3-O-methyltransferase-like [Zingiber officinale]KAG6535746.1 hypothetical protein ZIOFF_000769 [Zingiber officinale]